MSYYGCMANRPPEITEATDFENPQALDRIIQNLGATAIPWPYKTDCCGASQVLSRPDIVSQLVGKLYDMAQRVGAQAIVVSCQMCQANLDMHQEKIGADWGKRFSFPVYYFTELIGLAHDVAGVENGYRDISQILFLFSSSSTSGIAHDPEATNTPYR